MRIAQARLVPYRLPLKRPWIAAAATLAERRGALLCLTDADGRQGWGDCAPLPSSGEAGQAACLAALADYVRRAAETDFPDFPDAAAAPPEVRWAADTARLDLEAQRRGLPLARLLGAGGALRLAVNAALGPLDQHCAARAAAARAEGYAIGKIKVGLGGLAAELDGLHAVAEATGGRLRLRLDANRAWPQAEAERFLQALAGLPIDAVEEPLAAPTPAALAALQAALPYALAVDESLPALGLDALVAARAVRRLVLKPARLGGHAATQAIARRAAAAGLDVVLTSVVDSAIGLAAAAHLAAALAPGLAHGLGTGAWLARDVAAAPAIAGGWLTLPETPGLGLRPAC